jgi:hypothetical protein
LTCGQDGNIRSHHPFQTVLLPLAAHRKLIFMFSHTRLTTALALGTVLSCSFSAPAHADSLWESARNEVQHVWDDGTLDAYLPLNTYHMRWAYTKKDCRI